MSETTRDPGENAETLKDKQGQEKQTNKDLLESLSLLKDPQEEYEDEVDEKYRAEHKDELAIDYLKNNPKFFQKKILDEDCDLFCFYDSDDLEHAISPNISIDEEIQGEYKEEYNGEKLTSEKAEELIDKFGIFMGRTRQHHTLEKIKENWDIIKQRREKLSVLSHIGKDENPLFGCAIHVDILDDWQKLESLGLTDDKITMGMQQKIQDMIYLTTCVDIDDLEIAMKLTDEEVRKVVDIAERYYITDIYGHNFLELNNLTSEEIEKTRRNADYLGLTYIDAYTFIILSDISEEALDYCAKNGIKYGIQINFVKGLYKLKDKQKFKEYISRKQGYLSKNKTISDEKYAEYFGRKGKHGKQGIKQGKFGLCYMYSAIETLKKMNGFDELMQTNFIENEDGWLVRLPFQTGSWIQVGKDEIDKSYEVMDNSPEAILLRRVFGDQVPKRIIHINSDTESLGIKILEIACIKNMLINGKPLMELDWNIKNEKLTDSKIKKGRGTINNPLDLKKLTGDMLEKTEGGDSMGSLIEILGKGNVSPGIHDAAHDINAKITLERLEKAEAPKSFIDSQKLNANRHGKIKEIAFETFKSGFLSVYMRIDPDAIDVLGKWETKHKKFILVDDAKILDEYGNEMPSNKLEKKSDVSIDKSGNISARFFVNHAYSVEKCYVNEKGEKRMWVVNPRHTEMKFDVSFEQCRDIFERRIGIINFDNLFR